MEGSHSIFSPEKCEQLRPFPKSILLSATQGQSDCNKGAGVETLVSHRDFELSEFPFRVSFGIRIIMVMMVLI
jgi:hypothetical protein